jgi:hypothetical protein
MKWLTDWLRKLYEARTPISHSTEFLRVHYTMKQKKKLNNNGKANGKNALRQPLRNNTFPPFRTG